MQNQPSRTRRIHLFFFHLLMLALLLGFLRLAFWQLQREDDKQAILDAIENAPSLLLSQISVDTPVYTRLRGEGRFDHRHSFLLDNQVENGVVGVHLYTPLQTTTGAWLLVNRGWLPMPADRRSLPGFETPETPVQIQGQLRPPARTGVRLGSNRLDGKQWPKLITYLDIEPLAATLGYPLLPRVLQLDPQSLHGYGKRAAPPLNFGPEKHRGYAITWFTFAVVAVILYLVIMRLYLRKRKEQ